MIPINISIITPINKIEEDALKSIRDQLNKIMPKAAPIAKTLIEQKISRIFIGSNEYQALVNGPLDAHFGIPRGEALSRLDSILDTLAGSVEVKVRRASVRGNKLNGGLTVQAFKGDFSDILALPAASVNTGTTVLPWLEWLLTQGDNVILTDHEIVFGNYPKSRSGKAVMVKSVGKVWRVPVGVSGTINNNWITRAVDNSIGFLEKLITLAVEEAFRRAI